MAAPMILPSISSGAGTTRRIYRRALGDELGEFAVLTVSATPSTGTTPDAGRQVLVTALGSDGVDVARFDGAYVYVADGAQAGEVRRVLDGTFDGPIGSLLLDRPFSAPLASGTEIELSSPLPGGRHLTIKGLNEMVNEGLSRVRVLGRLVLTGDGSYSHDLDDYPWLTSADQIRGIYDWFYGISTSDPALLSPYAYDVRADGAGRALQTFHAYASGDTFEVEAFVRGDRLVARSGTWAYVDDPAGLVADEDMAAAPLHWVVAFGMRQALRHLIVKTRSDRTIPRDEKNDMIAGPGGYAERLRAWRMAAVKIKLEEFPQPLGRRTEPMLMASPAVGYS